MWTPFAVVLLAVATGEGVAVAVLLAERRRVRVALGEIQRDLQEALDRADRAAETEDPDPLTRPIGFRRAS